MAMFVTSDPLGVFLNSGNASHPPHALRQFRRAVPFADGLRHRLRHLLHRHDRHGGADRHLERRRGTHPGLVRKRNNRAGRGASSPRSRARNVKPLYEPSSDYALIGGDFFAVLQARNFAGGAINDAYACYSPVASIVGKHSGGGKTVGKGNLLNNVAVTGPCHRAPVAARARLW